MMEKKMAKLTPVAEVKDKFGSKENLAKTVLAQLERPEDESKEEFERRILTLSNRKLLKLNDAHEELLKRFGSKAALVDAIVALACVGKVDTTYKAKLERMRTAPLLDLHKSLARKAKKS
ncbi:MAG: hypothetical protein WC966_02160 [Bradymonadales bacterium]